MGSTMLEILTVRLPSDLRSHWVKGDTAVTNQLPWALCSLIPSPSFNSRERGRDRYISSYPGTYVDRKSLQS